jgi:hypothetical protein
MQGRTVLLDLGLFFFLEVFLQLFYGEGFLGLLHAVLPALCLYTIREM